jgi:thiosulfate/3-mercaptopyruvate sulfurtransferase
MTTGHIPGSLNLPFELLIDPDTHLMHSKEELLECKPGEPARYE